MRNLLKFLIRMHIVPVFVAWTSQIALTEIEAMRLADTMGVDTSEGTVWWKALYYALYQEGFKGILQIRMSDFIAVMGEDVCRKEYLVDLPSEEELV